MSEIRDNSGAVAMSKIPFFLLGLLIVAILYSTSSAATKVPANVWNYYHFDGSAFTPGPTVDGSAFVAIREDVQPVILTVPAAQIEPMSTLDRDLGI